MQPVENSEELKRLKMLVSQRDNEIMILLSLIEKYKKQGVPPEAQGVIVQQQPPKEEQLLNSMQQSKLVTFP
jgi:hypothetical protein